jgi:hypothetical protein
MRAYACVIMTVAAYHLIVSALFGYANVIFSFCEQYELRKRQFRQFSGNCMSVVACVGPVESGT